MERLHNSRGAHIANFQNGRLYAAGGSHIGYYLEDRQIFIDLKGRYLGEIYNQRRLMERMYSPHKYTHFGARGNSGSIGSAGNPGNIGSIGTIGGYRDIDPERLT